MILIKVAADIGSQSVWHRAPRTDLFVEIDPQQKERVVRALQKTGYSVGYLGDAINDAPALHAADVGISVEEAVDVARESADIILSSRDLDCLRSGVEDGRRTLANTLKYISITTSANFGNMVSMALATPLLSSLPLAAKQILLNNFLSDVPSIAISSDNVDPNRVSQPQRCNIKDIQRFMVAFGLIRSTPMNGAIGQTSTAGKQKAIWRASRYTPQCPGHPGERASNSSLGAEIVSQMQSTQARYRIFER